jgi:hypothetical protein
MDQLRSEFQDYAAFLRQALQLAPLRPEERRALEARRASDVERLARLAARAHHAFAPYLEDLSQAPEDLSAQEQRVALLAELYPQIVMLARELGDTLLRERTQLLDMSLSVLEALEVLLHYAELPPPLRRRMKPSRRALRRRLTGGDPPPRRHPPARAALPAPRRRRKRS